MPSSYPTATFPSQTEDAPVGTVGNASGNVMGLILQQLQIIAMLLREGLDIPDETSTLVQQSVPSTPPTSPTAAPT